MQKNISKIFLILLAGVKNFALLSIIKQGKSPKTKNNMKVSNFLSAGRSSKKMDNAVVNIHCNTSGSMANSYWNDYVQVSIYSKEKEKFIRLEMTLDEAKHFQEMLNNGMKKFEK